MINNLHRIICRIYHAACRMSRITSCNAMSPYTKSCNYHVMPCHHIISISHVTPCHTASYRAVSYTASASYCSAFPLGRSSRPARSSGARRTPGSRPSPTRRVAASPAQGVRQGCLREGDLLLSSRFRLLSPALSLQHYIPTVFWAGVYVRFA